MLRCVSSRNGINQPLFVCLLMLFVTVVINQLYFYVLPGDPEMILNQVQDRVTGSSIYAMVKAE